MDLKINGSGLAPLICQLRRLGRNDGNDCTVRGLRRNDGNQCSKLEMQRTSLLMRGLPRMEDPLTCAR